jgi:hypothetical protein
MLTVGLTLSGGAIAQAVAPVVISQNFNVEWSKVINDPFDGLVVFDKNFDAGGSFEFISRWSPQGIQATYRLFSSEIVGYRTVWKSERIKGSGNQYRTYSYPEREPIYRRFSRDRTPVAIKFAINNKVYTYETGAVAPDLAAALATAPENNMIIRLMWDDGGSTDMVIGRGTVAAWKTIFYPHTPATVVQ